jgi:hypothetical protein
MTAKKAPAPATPGRVFEIPEELLQSTVTTLAELPYNRVGNLVNQLRSLQPKEKT